MMGNWIIILLHCVESVWFYLVFKMFVDEIYNCFVFVLFVYINGIQKYYTEFCIGHE